MKLSTLLGIQIKIQSLKNTTFIIPFFKFHIIMLIHKLLVDLAPPFVTAKSWAICDGRTGEILFGKCENDRREIASLTKIMTCFVVI